MKRVVSKILIILIVISMLSPLNDVFAGTMKYYDNIDVSKFPQRLKDHLSNHPWQDGFLDITKQPYSAKGDGITDDTDAIQKAIDDAYVSNLIVYFPEGTYLVSKQLVLNQYPADWLQKDKNIKSGSQRKFGNILVGSTKGKQRPKIVLKDNSNINQNILLLFRYYDSRLEGVQAVNRSQHYLATIRGIDVDMGNNPPNSAISMDGAQYCTIQDINITGKSFYAGIHKIPGAVGSIINVKVSGGDIGILSDSYVPEALVAGVVLENQKEYGVKIVDSRNSPVNLVGFKIVSPQLPSSNYRAVYVDERGAIEKRGGKQSRAHVTLTDGTIEVKGDKGKAIESYNQYVILKNVYVKADTIINTGIKNPPIENVEGDKNNWKKINNYAFAPKDNNGYIHVDGKEYGNSKSDVQYHDDILNENSKEDFVNKHIWPVKMPSYDDEDKVNIVTDYGATPYNNDDDDTVAIQKAIDDTTTEGNGNFGKSIFIPRGHFHVKSTITLKKGTKIFGAGKNISVIHESPDFKILGNTAIVDTVNDKDANIIMSDFAILRQESSQAKGLTNNKYVSMLRVRGNNTVFRDVQFASIEENKDNYYLNSEMIFTENAGGKFYNVAVNTSVKTSSGGNIHGDYRRVLIDGVTNPLTIYQCGVNNTEKAYLMEVRNSNNISIYAIKYEEQNQLLKIKDSSNISITGGYGYFTVVDNIDSIINIENSKQIYLAGIARNTMNKYEERKDKNWIINGKDFIKDDNDIILYIASSVYSKDTKEELLLNNDFEKGLDNWKANGNAQIEEENEKVYQGVKAIKITNQKSKDDSVVQDITSVLQKNGPGKYSLSAWMSVKSKKNSKVNSKKESHKDKSIKAYIKIELKHDGITEYFTVEDNAYDYWNRISDTVNLSWKKLESAKIYIENPHLKTDYYIDEMSFSKDTNSKDVNVKQYSNIKSYNFFLIPVLGVLIVAYMKVYRKNFFRTE
ncbi:glycosyl hydrolase family 28-related protein [Clostridium ganghwense]|uniref:Glycosyl hydrolase family 28-related protein n=1 Tax=Clostridium ganghwense TaxID=312089 RepID=A0ABT4CLL8_9CLOT|nr:glycosyl hydrolase family 28-related protein [Clostridium ganghwense]MCY6369939.1 glycosyl hydrolase family 28-related protein [Clostridium ganghwense]